MKTQQEINELADAYYDGMANVMDRFDQINKVDETKKYIMARFGRLPEDDEVSELIVEYKTLEVHKSKTIESFFFKLFIALILVCLCFVAVFSHSIEATIILVVLIVFGGLIYIMEK